MKKMNLMIGLLIAVFMLPVGVSAQSVDDQTGKKVKVSGVIIDVETQKGEKEKGTDWVMFSVLYYRPADTVRLVRLEGDRDEGSPSTQST